MAAQLAESILKANGRTALSYSKEEFFAGCQIVVIVGIPDEKASDFENEFKNYIQK